MAMLLLSLRHPALTHHTGVYGPQFLEPSAALSAQPRDDSGPRIRDLVCEFTAS